MQTMASAWLSDPAGNALTRATLRALREQADEYHAAARRGGSFEADLKYVQARSAYEALRAAELAAVRAWISAKYGPGYAGSYYASEVIAVACRELRRMA